MWRSLQRYWYKYVTADHFVIGSFAAVFLPFWPALLLMAGVGLVHEYMDGDFTGSKIYDPFYKLNPPMEGWKDLAWFVIPVFLKLVQ